MSLSSNGSAQHTHFEAAIKHFEDQIFRDVKEDGIGSITAAVVMGNDEIWAKGFGWADTQRQIPADTETVYRVGSNIGYGILGLAISRAAQKPYMDLITDLIFHPLKMTSSRFVLTSEMGSRLAAGYEKQEDGTLDAGFPAREHAGRGYKVPNGGMYSTVGDLGRFIAAQTGSSTVHILSAESRAEMQKIQTPGSEGSGYGLGFNVQIEEGRVSRVGHGGGVAGYNAYMVFNPESGIGVVLLRNYTQGQTQLGQCANSLLREWVAGSRTADL